MFVKIASLPSARLSSLHGTVTMFSPAMIGMFFFDRPFQSPSRQLTTMVPERSLLSQNVSPSPWQPMSFQLT